MIKVCFTTRIPSPYQVELFDALEADGKMEVRVLYEMPQSVGRQWDRPTLAHDHRFASLISLKEAWEYIAKSDLVVFSGYRNKFIRKLISQRDREGRAWAFWGERPGFIAPPWISRFYRRAVFPELASSQAAVWGIGGWAVDGYRRELGGGRLYCNVPYFSRLERFLEIDRSLATDRPQRVLFSGSLIKRKGVDILLSAFKKVAVECPRLELHFVGDGPLRDKLSRSAAPLGKRVVFHGFKQWQELQAIYAKSDILCAPSRHDGWGLIVPEGLAAGLLVISTDHTGAALDLVTFDTGWIAKAGSVESLEAALRAASASSGDERLQRIRKNRDLSRRLDVSVGLGTITEAVEQSITCFGKSKTSNASSDALTLRSTGDAG